RIPRDVISAPELTHPVPTPAVPRAAGQAAVVMSPHYELVPRTGHLRRDIHLHFSWHDLVTVTLPPAEHAAARLACDGIMPVDLDTQPVGLSRDPHRLTHRVDLVRAGVGRAAPAPDRPVGLSRATQPGAGGDLYPVRVRADLGRGRNDGHIWL